MSANIQVKAVVVGQGAFTTKMPLAGKEGPVTALLQGLSQASVLVGEMEGIFRGQDPVIAIPVLSGCGTNPVSNSMSGRVFPCHDAGTGRRTYLTGSVAMREAHSLPCDAIDVRSLMVCAAFDGEVPDSEVIREDKENIGSSGERMGPCEEKKGESAEHDGR